MASPFFTFDQLHAFPALTPPARLAVIGDPIAHSKSPQMHNPALMARGIEAQYVRVQVPVGHVKEAFDLFTRQGFLGVNITIPHKFEALKAVDNVDDLTKRLGAVNTLAIRNGRLFGFNTDGPGFVRSVKEAFGIGLKNLKILFLGAGGGAGQAVAIQCAIEGAKVFLANRSSNKAHKLQQDIINMGMTNVPTLSAMHENPSPYFYDIGDISKCDMIVNATPLGMKKGDQGLIPPGSLEKHHLVYDMVYRSDGPTDLIQQATRAGARHADGMSLLLHQGAISFEHWFGGDAPLEVMRTGLMNAQAAIS